MATRTIAPGGGNWSAASTWVEGIVPTSADEVVATPLSGNLNIDAAAACRALDLADFLGTLLIQPAVTLSIGDATLPTGNVALRLSLAMRIGCATTVVVSSRPAAVGTINFVSTAVGQQIVDVNGHQLGNVTFSGAGASWLLLTRLVITHWSTLTLTAGTLNTNNLNHDWGRFHSSNSNVRTLTLGSSEIQLHSLDSSASWDTATVTNLTVTANTAHIFVHQHLYSGNNLVQSATKDWAGMSMTLHGSGGAIHTTNVGNSIFYNFSVLDDHPHFDEGLGNNYWFTATRWQVNSSGFTITNKLTVRGYDSGRRIRMHTNSGTSLRTFTVTGATVDIDYTDLQSIQFSTLQDFSTRTVGDEGTNGANCVFPVGETMYFYAPGTGDKRWSYPGYWWRGSGGTGGPGRVPLPQDTCRFDANSLNMAGVRVVCDVPRFGGVDWTGVLHNPVWHHQQLAVCYGDIVLAAGMTMTATRSASFTQRWLGAALTRKVTSNGVVWPLSFTFTTAAGITFQLQDDFVSTSSFILSTTTSDLNEFDVTCATFNNSAGALDMTNSTITLTGTGTVWSSGGTLSAVTGSLIKITDESSLAKTFAGNGRTYNDLEISGAGEPCNIIFTGSNTFNEFKDIKSVAHRLLFTAATNTTATTWTVSGTAPNGLITIASVTAASHTLTKAGGGAVAMDYMIISRSTASPAATFTAGANSVNAGNNTNWAGFADQPFTWTGAVDNLWSTPGNWFGGAVPGSGDVAYFTGAYNIACTMDIAVDVRGIHIDTTYTATITQAATIKVGFDGWVQRGGTFTGATQTFETTADIAIFTGATFTPTTGITTFNGTADQVILTVAAFTNSNIVVNKASGILRLSANLTMNTVGQTLTVTAGRFDTNGFTLTVNSSVTIDGEFRSTGGDLTVGSISFNTSTSTLILASTNSINFNTVFGFNFFNLTLNASKILSFTADQLTTIHGTLAPGTADLISGQGTPQRGQCSLKSTLEGIRWKLALLGQSTVGPGVDIKDCDARYGNWFEAPGSMWMTSDLCTEMGNYRAFSSPRQSGQPARRGDLGF